MIINVEDNRICVTNETHKPTVLATLNFEKVIDSEDLSKEVGILPIFSIYVSMFDGSEESGKLYKEYYKEILAIMGVLFPEVHYINTFDSVDKIYCLKNSIIDSGEIIKIPYSTTLKLHN